MVEIEDHGGGVNKSGQQNVAALTAAFAASDVVYAVRGLYELPDVTVVVPAGKTLIGSGHRYFDDPTSGFKRMEDGTNPLFEVREHATLIGVVAQGFIRKLAQGFNRVSTVIQLKGQHTSPDTANITLDRVTACNGTIGVAANYQQTCTFIACNLYSNDIGLRDPLDSQIIGCYINGNKTGIDFGFQTNADLGGAACVGNNCGGGSNDNVVSGGKIEWNEGDGIRAWGSRANIVMGTIIDRNGLAGIRLNKCEKWTISGAVLKRNGRSAAANSGDDYHLIADQTSHLSWTGGVTEHGKNDDGTEYDSPRRAVQIKNSSDILITGVDLSGFTQTTKAPVHVGGTNTGVRIVNSPPQP